MSNNITIETKRTKLEILEPDSAHLLLRYYIENNQHLSVWEPERSANFFTLEAFDERVNNCLRDYKLGHHINFSILNPEGSEVIGVCNFSNIVHGIFQACHLGYSIAEKHQGKGLMFEALSAGIDYMFTQVNLHRVMANYMPHNKRSANLLKHLGFEVEGVAKSYLKINGKWCDHVLTSKINPAHL